MKYIVKRAENQPLSFIRHKKKSSHSYKNYAEKDDLREALLKEQEFLCCYCMRRIQTATEDKMKIEHFKPFSVYNGKNGNPDLTLEYSNLFASCKGDEKRAKHLQHCDKTKENKEIKLNPTDKSLMDLIKFTPSGIILTDNEELDNEIDNILKLNIQPLKNGRKEIWESLEQVLKKEFGNKTVTKGFLNNKIRVWKTKSSQGMSKEYCQVAIYFLTKRLAKAQ